LKKLAALTTVSFATVKKTSYSERLAPTATGVFVYNTKYVDPELTAVETVHGLSVVRAHSSILYVPFGRIDNPTSPARDEASLKEVKPDIVVVTVSALALGVRLSTVGATPPEPVA
jgi:hypothetical protein